jgi:UDP-N-acetylmuramoylalanine--D-glutamate ligase
VVTFGEDEPNQSHWGIRTIDGVRWLTRGEHGVIEAKELPIAGRHNELNVLASMALVSGFEIPAGQLVESVRTFVGLEHRCQRVLSHGGVDYINDSKATNIGATRAALLGFAGTTESGQARVVLIGGGDGKGADFTVLEDVVSSFVKTLILFGQDAELMAEALGDVTEVHQVANMSAAVRLASTVAEPGDLVLLSPACASLDMYTNFAARGDDFISSVEALAA